MKLLKKIKNIANITKKRKDNKSRNIPSELLEKVQQNVVVDEKNKNENENNNNKVSSSSSQQQPNSIIPITVTPPDVNDDVINIELPEVDNEVQESHSKDISDIELPEIDEVQESNNKDISDIELPEVEEVIESSDKDQIDDNLKDVSLSQTSNKVIAGKVAFKIVTTSLAAAKPFFPWIESVSIIINEIVNQYEAVEYNKKTCLILIERVEMIGLSVKTLTRRREENLEKFQSEDYYHSFIRLEKVLKLVKSFIMDISELKGYRKFILASDVKTKANQHLNSLEECSNHLQFSIIISLETRMREQQSLDEDVANMTKFLKSIESEQSILRAEGVKISKVVNSIYEEILVFSRILSDLSDDKKEKSVSNKQQTIFNTPTIDPKELYDTEESVSEISTNKSRKLVKKLLRNAIPVACKTLNIIDNSNSSHEAKRIKTELSILNSIQSSNRVIRFHGTSMLNGSTLLVFDWAEHGNLKGLYEREQQLKWVDKLKIVHDIASGLVFLQACKIYHHDIRCENILITGDARFEAKIAKFRQSREHDVRSTQIKTYNTIIRWLAPEKMPKDQKVSNESYTFKCEIFSFGMLLWELGAQRLPYKDMDMKEIITHVMDKKRETFEDFNTLHNGLFPSDDNKESIIAKGFINIIESAWAHGPNQRPTINNIYQELDSLVEIHSPPKRPNNSSGDVSTKSLSENSKNIITTPEEDDNNLTTLETILTLEEGIKAHRDGKKDVAWGCFDIHATLGDPVAIYWKAYYYLKGYYVKPPVPNTNEAIKHFKQAADANVPEAQYYYANALQKAKKPGSLFLEYFIKSADNDYVLAQRELGLIYYKGLNGVEKNEEKGIQYLKLAALKNNQNAIKDLKEIDPELLAN